MHFESRFASDNVLSNLCHFTLCFMQLSVCLVEGVALWERPDGYESDSIEDKITKEKEPILLEFQLTDDFGNEVPLISELIRMQYIHADTAEISSILSGKVSDDALKKLQILQAHLNMYGTEWEWMNAIQYGDYNFLSYLLLYMNINTHNDLKEYASKCLAFLSNVYPKIWHDYLGTISPHSSGDGAQSSSIVNKYVMLNIVLLIHTGIGQICEAVVRLANSKIEDQLRNIHVNNSNYIGFDTRDIQEFNLNAEDYDLNTTARDRNDASYISLSSVITHGIIGMEDVCDAEASVRVWLLLLTQIFAFVPSLHAVLNVSACSTEEYTALNTADRRECAGMVVDDYLYPAMEDQLMTLHDYLRAYFLSKTASDAATNARVIDQFLSVNGAKWGAIAVSAATGNTNAVVYTCFFKKFLVRSADVLLRHAKYFSNDAYPLAIKYIATVNYQLQQLELQTSEHETNCIIEALYFLHSHGKEGCTINISEMLLHVLNENGYPAHDSLETIPCITLCKDIISHQLARDKETERLAQEEAEAQAVAVQSKSVFRKALAARASARFNAASIGTSESSYMYTNDMRIVIDLIERELINLPSSSSALVKNDTRSGTNRRGSVSSLQTSCLGMSMADFNYKVKLA